MASRECPNCAVAIEDSSTACPICKYEFAQRQALPWKPVAIILLVVLLIPVVIQLNRMFGR